jgi:hypothetical protein
VLKTEGRFLFEADLHGDGDSGGDVGHSDGRLCGVDMLPSCPRCTKHVHSDVGLAQIHVHLARQHKH